MEEGLLAACGGGHYLPTRALPLAAPAIVPLIIAGCVAVCGYYPDAVIDAYRHCNRSCKGRNYTCVIVCMFGELAKPPTPFALLACLYCICLALLRNPLQCLGLLKKAKQKIKSIKEAIPD